MRSRRKRLRREAAVRALEGPGAASGEVDDEELTAMRDLVAALGELPAAAWRQVPARPASRRTRLARSRSALAAAGLAIAAVLIVVGYVIGFAVRGPGLQRSAPAHARAIALRPVRAGARGDATALIAGSGQMVLIIHSLARSAPGTYYELWEMSSLSKLVPVSAFRENVSGQTTLYLVLPADPTAYTYLDISLQQTGAGPAHSADSVLRGDLS